MIKRLTLAALLAMALLPRGFSQQPPPLRNSLGRRTLPVGGVAFPPNGGIANQRSVAQFLPHGLDGIHFDEYGRLWIAHYTARSVEVVTQTGELLKSYDIGADQVSNLVFHKGKLYVTATGGQCVYMYDVGLNGLEQ